MGKAIVIGAGGQIGTELVTRLRELKGNESVISADIKDDCPENLKTGPYVQMDILNKEFVRKYIIDNGIEEVYLLAALLSATAEKNPVFAWNLNMNGLFVILDLAREKYVKKVFWPSSIAVFGPTTPKVNTPQLTIMEPTTVYGISKQAGERWCEYYHDKYGVDVRSLRYPGLISYTSLPGGGTTDYAVDIFYHAKANQPYNCFLKEDTSLPMMFMDDAIRATIELMNSSEDQLTVRSSYNLSGCSFTPAEIAAEIKKHVQDFEVTYSPDFRQRIADSWPESIDDSQARKDWDWQERYDLKSLVSVMLENVKPSLIG